LLDLKNLPAFYKNVLVVWQELNSKDPIAVKEIQHEILWSNCIIRINGKSIYFKTWVNKGNLKICHLLDPQGQFLSFENFICKFGVRNTFLDYTGILAAILKLRQRKILGNSPMGGQPSSFLLIATPSSPLKKLVQYFSPPIVDINLRKQVSNVKDANELPLKVTVENKLRSFQSKIAHNIIPTNLSLYKMNIKKHHNASTASSKMKHLFLCFWSALQLNRFGKML